jgi:DNA-binding transcriptional MerR regulator
LRDDAGFSLAEIAELLEDEAAREREHVAFHSTSDPDERRRLLLNRLVRYEHQAQMLRAKVARLQAMVDETEGRRARTAARLEALAAELASISSEPEKAR